MRSPSQAGLLSDPLLAPAPEIEGYKVLGGVVLYQKLGQGGMGAVYRGKHLRLEVDVALKVMAPPDIAGAPLPPAELAYSPVPVMVSSCMRYTDFRETHGGRDGLIYLRTTLGMRSAGRGRLLFGADGPVRVWVNGEPVACVPDATNPIARDEYEAPALWKKGANRVVFAVATNRGQAWGVASRGVAPAGRTKSKGSRRTR